MFLGEVEQNGIAVEHRMPVINDSRKFRIGIDLNIVRAELLTLANVDRYRLVGEIQFFEQQRDLVGVGGAAEIELDHLCLRGRS